MRDRPLYVHVTPELAALVAEERSQGLTYRRIVEEALAARYHRPDLAHASRRRGRPNKNLDDILHHLRRGQTLAHLMLLTGRSSRTVRRWIGQLRAAGHDIQLTEDGAYIVADADANTLHFA
jgi:hypothetical protein